MRVSGRLRGEAHSGLPPVIAPITQLMGTELRGAKQQSPPLHPQGNEVKQAAKQKSKSSNSIATQHKATKKDTSQVPLAPTKMSATEKKE